ncbi:MAG: argininosuccinate synthase [Candidatus Margulisbacteria bacterium]|nr:argininosuccinate synthase [Candidatus Margulisiibacteriota bacterium]
MKEKAVLAYSGGLDTSIMIPWLKEHYKCDVIAMCADLGQESELEGLKEKALKSGASKVFIEDLRSEFITDYIYPVLKAGAIYERAYLLGTSFARPLIAKRQVEIAQQEGATMLVHGATGKGTDQVRFELAYMGLDPSLKVIAPWKDALWTFRSREDLVTYAEVNNIPVGPPNAKKYSEDRNIWHISHEGEDLENPENEAPDDVFSISNTLLNAPNEPEYITIHFEEGIPTQLNNQKLTPLALMQSLNELGGKHAVGHVDIVENRLVGIKTRGVYETPGGTLLYAAHRHLESVVLDRDTLHFKDHLSTEYATLVYDGKWFTPLRYAMDQFVNVTQQFITGNVTLKLYKGNVVPAGIKANKSLYFKELSSFKDSDMYDQKDAKGFIQLFGLSVKMNGLLYQDKMNMKNRENNE